MKVIKASVLLFLLLGIFSTYALASSITATQTGNWNQTDTWGGSTPPGCYDTIIIPPSVTVTITVNVDLTGCPPVAVIVQGNLAFQNGRRLHLPNGSHVYIAPGATLNDGGGGGSSTLITIGGTDYWSAGCTGNPPPNCGTISGPAIICQNCALPIELVKFTAQLIENYVLVEWETASESNNDYFLIQRSNDGINWVDIGKMDGANNSSSLLLYSFEDRTPLLGLSYYRLKQVDNDGAFSVSEIRVVSNNGFYSNQQLLVLTNQYGYQQNIVIYFSEPISGVLELIIVQMDGKIIYSETKQVKDEKWVVVSLDNVPAAGVFAVRANQKIEKVFFK